MSNNYLRCGLALAFATFVMTGSAQVTPRVTGETPVDKQEYVLMNKAQNPNQYMTRTSWDGALYFLEREHQDYVPYTLAAVKNEDGTWSFTSMLDNHGEVLDEPVYMALPEQSANINMVTTPASWILEPQPDGFYRLQLGEGNSETALSKAEFTDGGKMYMHLNKGAQYFVTTYMEGPWFPDCVGDITISEDEVTGVMMFNANDSISFSWAFVLPEKAEAYQQDRQAVSVINDLKENYCDIDDYAAGFEQTYAAVAAIYESETYEYATDCKTINDMIAAKKALYEEILFAIEYNEPEGDVLTVAIANAKAVFNEQTDAAVLLAAVEALKEAELAYSLAQGDVTAMGQNMSFEDLSSQNGSVTSGVAGAPAGWNVYVNGKQVVTADDVRTAGITAWHGINADSNGDIKDGSMAFGLWMNGVPSYEISQTIEGLENGTYVITAGLMAGSNGQGSRLTTQRIFGNLNATYYAAKEDYVLSELDPSEVYAFADNEIISTDTEMRPVSVRAYVYDGTLTFGLRTDGNYKATGRETSNGAGGDGWFKIDNFTIQSEGYVAEDAVAIYAHYFAALRTCMEGRMDCDTQDKLNDNLDNWSGLDTDTPQAEITAAILGIKELLGEAVASSEAYARLEELINQHENYYDQYADKRGAGKYRDAIDEVIDGYENGTIAPAQLGEIIASLDAALQECIKSDEILEGDELTDYIQNPSFEDLSAQNNISTGGVANPPVGWSLYIDGQKMEAAADIAAASPKTGWCAINNGDDINVMNTYGETVTKQYTDGEHLWGIWSNEVPETELSQTIDNLPAGTYTVSVDMVVQNDWAGANLATQRLFANAYVCMFGSEYDYIWNEDDETVYDLPADVLGAKRIDQQNEDADIMHLNYAGKYSTENYGASSAPYTMGLTFGLAEPGSITFGVRTNRLSATDGQISSQASKGWLKVDNFRLVYESMDVPLAAEATGIRGITTSAASTVYSLGGVRLAVPQRGINIVRKADGTMQKVVVK